MHSVQIIEKLYNASSKKNKPVIHKSGIHNVFFGKDVKIVEPVNLYECELGDHCFVGPFTEIQKGVKVGNNCRIQSHSFICELVTIGSDCFIGHGVMFINDTFSDGKFCRRRSIKMEENNNRQQGFNWQ